MVIFLNDQVRGFHKAVASQFSLSGLSVSIVMAGLVTLSSCSNSTTLVDPPFVPHYQIIAELESTPFYLVPAGDREQQVLVALESGPVRPRFDELKAWNFASNDDTDFHIRSVASSIEANYLAVSVDGVMDSLRLVSFGELSNGSTWTITRCV